MKIGVIGGSGLYGLEGIESMDFAEVTTPFGAPSDAYACGTLAGRGICFLPRHGRGHRLLPSEINHRANICGMKMLGVDVVVSISAVGSLREALRPRDLVLPDQYFDRTKSSGEHTFFGNGVVAHIAFGDPTCEALRHMIAESARDVLADADATVTVGGTYVNMEGPAFSTKAESRVYRQLGFDVIGMTSLAEAKLCREAELCYQAAAMITDYDCWHESEAGVSVEMVIGHLMANTAMAKKLLQTLVPRLPDCMPCACNSALANALMTNRDSISEEARARLKPIIGKYV